MACYEALNMLAVYTRKNIESGVHHCKAIVVRLHFPLISGTLPLTPGFFRIDKPVSWCPRAMVNDHQRAHASRFPPVVVRTPPDASA